MRHYSHSALQSFQKLTAQHKKLPGTNTAKDIRNILSADLRKAQRSCASTNCHRKLKTLLSPMKGRIKDWKLEDHWDTIGVGLEAAYRRGRKAFANAKKDASSECFHEWRKRTKDLWYHLRMLLPIWPPVMSSLVDEVERLGESLGNEHDLAVLKEFLGQLHLQATSTHEVKSLFRVINSLQEELKSTAIGIGCCLYAEQGKAFSHRMETYWNHWRAECE